MTGRNQVEHGTVTDAVTGITIREARERDARSLKRFGELLLGETPFFHRLPAERAGSVEEMEVVIRSMRAAPCCALMNAWRGDTPVGEAILVAGQLDRIRHTATVGIGVLQAYSGKGLGQRLMHALEKVAAEGGIVRLELTVMTTNERAIAFYRRQGYQEEGRKIASVQIDGRYVDELVMAKLLRPIRRGGGGH